MISPLTNHNQLLLTELTKNIPTKMCKLIPRRIARAVSTTNITCPAPRCCAILTRMIVSKNWRDGCPLPSSPAGKQWALNNFYTALLTCQNICRKNVAIFVSQSTVSTWWMPVLHIHKSRLRQRMMVYQLHRVT